MKMTVNLPTYQYDIFIQKGGLKELGAWVQKLWSPRKIMIITDQTVNEFYGNVVKTQLENAGFMLEFYVIEPGEQSKSLTEASKIYTAMSDFQMTRSDSVIALGGGVVGDLAGFVSSTYMRGLSFVQIPTTLLAQVDSSVGGKTAVNSTTAKNLIGTFAQPAGVLIDPETLETLEIRRIREGLAEVIKSAAIADLTLWEELEKYQDEADILEHAESIIYQCVDIKRKVVEADELDNGERLILNFGHTIGHAIEQVAGFGVITHGEAVAMGMFQMCTSAERLGKTPHGTTEKLTTMLRKYHLPIDSSELDRTDLFNAILHDKKARGHQLKVILLESLGKAKIETIQIEKIKDFLAE